MNQCPKIIKLKMRFLHLSILFFLTVFSGDCYRILAVLPTPAPSHYILGVKLVKELARRGHEVVMINPFPEKQRLDNVTIVNVDSLVARFGEIRQHLLSLDDKSFFGKVNFITNNVGLFLTELTLEHENVQKLLNSNEKFDLILMTQFMNDAHMGFAYKFQAPVVMLATMPPFAWGSFMLSHPSPPSYVPNIINGFTAYMSFWQRCINSLYDTYAIIYYQLAILPKHRELVRKYIPNSPDLYDFVHNVSFLLINSHVSVSDAIPRVHNAIDIGGFHVDEPKPLPEDLQEFLDRSINGVVLFSMGSNLKSSELPIEKRDAILRVFAKLKQNVIWKWEADDIPNLPKNVKIMKWLPQQDILAHRNVQAFITHGGLLSTTETVYHGVPIIGIPIFTDQHMNMQTAVSHGYAEYVSLQNLNEETLGNALDQILNNPKYKENILKRSRIMHDRPMKPIDTAIYWIEYVARHKGAPHLRYAGMELTWYQRNLLDVVAFFVILITIPVVIVRKLFKKPTPSIDKNKKIS